MQGNDLENPTGYVCVCSGVQGLEQSTSYLVRIIVEWWGTVIVTRMVPTYLGYLTLRYRKPSFSVPVLVLEVLGVSSGGRACPNTLPTVP